MAISMDRGDMKSWRLARNNRERQKHLLPQSNRLRLDLDLDFRTDKFTILLRLPFVAVISHNIIPFFFLSFGSFLSSNRRLDWYLMWVNVVRNVPVCCQRHFFLPNDSSFAHRCQCCIRFSSVFQREWIRDSTMIRPTCHLNSCARFSIEQYTYIVHYIHQPLNYHIFVFSEVLSILPH